MQISLLLKINFNLQIAANGLLGISISKLSWHAINSFSKEMVPENQRKPPMF